MKFKGLDLNLLVALEALLSERSVSNAAKRTDIGQSAMSSALNRLREYFEDELLVTGGRKTTITPRGLALLEPVRAALAQVERAIVATPEFDPHGARRAFRIAAPDYIAETFLADALKGLETAAPNVSIWIQAPTESAEATLEQPGIDMLFTPRPYAAETHPSAPVLTSDYACVVWSGSKAFGKAMDEEQFLNAAHVIAGRDATRRVHWEELVFQRYRRRLAPILGPNHGAIPSFIVGTDRIGTMYRFYAERLAAIWPLRVMECPIPIAPVEEVMQWSALADSDPGVKWLRDHLVAAARPGGG